jgi:hypothetical protein
MSKKSKARELAIEELKELGDDVSLEKLMGKMIEGKNIVEIGTWLPGERQHVYYLEPWWVRIFKKLFAR